MPTYKAAPGTQVSSTDQGGNVWPEPFTFDDKGLLKVPDDQQDVVAALESAVANGVVTKVKG